MQKISADEYIFNNGTDHQVGEGAGPRRGAPTPAAAPHVNSTLVKAIARAFRWQKLLETGQYATIEKAERINPSYVSRVLKLTLLAPVAVEGVLNGRAVATPTLAEAMGVFSFQ